MFMAKIEVLHLTPSERGELQSYLRKRNLPASVAQRMRIVLLLDEGVSYREIEERLGAFPSTISRWKQRYEKDGVLGLATIHPGQPPKKLTPQLRARVLERTRQAPADGSTHWSLRKMAAVMKVSKNLIARIWKEADLKPHRLERYLASNDPQFEEKAAAIIGLYLNPPQNAAVFCVDEKSAIQALDRLDRRLPLSPGRAEKHGFEYYRHGTLSLYAALNPQTGEVIGQTAARHTSQEFVAFLEEVVGTQPVDREVHVILDNFATHKTELVQRFLASLEPLLRAGKLGPALFQLPPNFKADAALLGEFLGSLPKGLCCAFEFRHASWFSDPVYDALRRHNAALCVAESEDMTVPDVCTANFCYYRLRKPEYSAEERREIADKMRAHLAAGRDAFVFLKHEESPEGALYAADLLEGSGTAGTPARKASGL